MYGNIMDVEISCGLRLPTQIKNVQNVEIE
jgi:hypothetical protein